MGNDQIIDVDVNPIIEKRENIGNKILYTGVLEINFTLANSDLQMEIRNSKIPFEYTVDDVENSENANCNLDIEVANQDFIVQEQDYSIILYIVKKDDTLWKIAKKYGSTVEDIVRTNGIEDENKITIGQKLFIPRYVKTGISYV